MQSPISTLSFLLPARNRASDRNAQFRHAVALTRVTNDLIPPARGTTPHHTHFHHPYARNYAPLVVYRTPRSSEYPAVRCENRLPGSVTAKYMASVDMSRVICRPRSVRVRHTLERF